MILDNQVFAFKLSYLFFDEMIFIRNAVFLLKFLNQINEVGKKTFCY